MFFRLLWTSVSNSGFRGHIVVTTATHPDSTEFGCLVKRAQAPALGSRFEPRSISTNNTSLPRCHEAPCDASRTFETSTGTLKDRGDGLTKKEQIMQNQLPRITSA